jgi:hypothetical protein
VRARIIVRAQRSDAVGPRPLKLIVRHMDTTPPLIYDYGGLGSRVSSFSIPVILGIGLFMLLLAVGTLLLPWTSSSAFSVVILLGIGGWMTLSGLHLRRDRHALFTRYVLNDIGLEETSAHLPSRSVPWSEITLAYQSRLLRYYRVTSPVLSPDVVLIFGAPPKSQVSGPLKYEQTRALLEQKLESRFQKGWL